MNYIYRLTNQSTGKEYIGTHSTDNMYDKYLCPSILKDEAYLLKKKVIAMFATIEECNDYAKTLSNTVLTDTLDSVYIDTIEYPKEESDVTDKPIKEKKQRIKKEKLHKERKLLYTQDDIDKFKEIIDSNTVDFTKHGWVGKMIKLTGCNKSIVHKLMSKEFPETYATVYHHVEKSKQIWVTDGINKKRIAECYIDEWESKGWKRTKPIN